MGRMSNSEYSLTLPVVASRLGLPWYTAHRLALRAELGPVQQVAGRWLLTERGVMAYEQRRKLTAKSHTRTASHANQPGEAAEASETGKATARSPRARAVGEGM